MFIFISLLCIGFLGGFVHFYFENQPKTRARLIELLLLYQLIFSVGMTSFLAFIGLSFMPEYIANYTGWLPCPFEQQLANVNLAFGVLGILCFWLRGHFWTATCLGFSIWIFSDGVHHFVDSIQRNNQAPGNVGIPFYTDILVPAALITLLIFYLAWRKIL